MTMNTKKRNLTVLATAAIALGFVLVSGIVVQPAFAHAHRTLDVSSDHVAGKKISIVLGYTNEPAYGAKDGIHSGEHAVEVLLSDAATELPLTGASLRVDKYYFKSITSFNNAENVTKADEVMKNVSLPAAFGDPGHYTSRQVQMEGIYGYRLYGTISYFGIASIPVDTTVFCTSSDGPTNKFNSQGWSGSFGCTDDIADTAFPSKNGALNGVSNEIEAGSAVAAQTPVSTSSLASMSMFQLLAVIGVPIAAVGGFIGGRSFKRQKRD